MATLDDYKLQPSGDPIIDALLDLDGYRPTLWPANQALRYAFLDTQTPPADSGGVAIFASDIIAMNNAQKNATSELMDYVSDLLNLPVIEVSPEDKADIFFASADLEGSTAGLTYSGYRYDETEGVVSDFLTTAVIYLDISNVGSTSTNEPVKGNMGYEVLLHEIGHALGLRHPFNGPNAVDAGTDHTGLSIMSYTDGPESPYGEFQAWDLAALAYLYPTMTSIPVISGTSGVDIQRIAADWNPLGGAQSVIADDNTITITLDEQVTIYENIERLAFNNGTLAFDKAGTAGQVYRLYQTTLNREPDSLGLSYWVNQMDQGAPLHEVTKSFLQSSEFNALYGDNTNEAFLTALYQNALNRTPDTSGFTFWMNKLDSGADQADVVAGFSESLENKANLDSQLSDGIWLI